MNLTALQNSPFLQSLGWAIANSLWQAAALWIAYHLVIGIYKTASAKFKNNFSTVLLSSAFVWFCVTFFIKYFAIEDLPGTYEIQYYNANAITTAATWNELLNKVAGILPYLSVAYLLLLIFLSFRLINIYRFTRFIKVNGLQKPVVEWKLFTEKVARHMGLTKKIRLWVSHHIDVPATIGFIKPVILIPLASINQLSADQLEAIILHELSHIKRNDYLINLFISIIETILFFNPFIALLAKIIKRERENCCDDFVIQYQYDRHAYASALLSLEQFRNVNLRLAIGATSGKKQLLLRIKRIMEVNSDTNFNYGQKLAALLLITGIICSVAWLSPQNKEAKKQLVNKSGDKVLNSKTNSNEKPETLFVNVENNNNEGDKGKNIAKAQPKKILTATEKQLKELRDLNLKAIAEGDYKLANRLFQESKKQIIRKPLQKFNLNRFLMARGTGNSQSLFGNGKALLSLANVEFNQQQLFSVDMEKLQSDLDKAHFSFSFDYDQLQNTMKQVMELQQARQKIQRNQSLKDAEIQKQINTEVQVSGEGRKLQRVRIATVSGTYASANGTIYIVDSVNRQIKIINDRVKHLIPAKVYAKASAPCENINTTDPLQYGYAYSYVVDNEEKVKKNTSTTRVANGTSVSDVKQSPCAPGIIYRTRPNVNPETTPVPRTKTTHTNEIRVEYKNGVVVINGKKIELPDTHDMFALYSVKGKKLLSKAKDLAEPHIDD